MTEFAVVIVNYASPELSIACARSALVDEPAELVVVDNASPDDSVSHLRAALPGATIAASPENRGFAAGVNRGFAATDAPVVVVLNPDCEVQPGALRRLVAALDGDPRAGVAVPSVHHEDGREQFNALSRLPDVGSVVVDLSIPVGDVVRRLRRLDGYRIRLEDWPHAEAAWGGGMALAIRRDAYAAAGPFDEGFFLYFEETEWQARVGRAGWRIALVPDARVVHLVRGGGTAALAPSPHFVRSARRYLRLRGHRPRLVDLALRLAILSSMAWVRLWRLVPGAAVRDRRLVDAWDEVWGARS